MADTIRFFTAWESPFLNKLSAYCSEDIINYLGWEVDNKTSCDTNNNIDDLTEDEKNIVELIAYEPINVEKIALKTNININDLMIMLSMLELKGIIKQLPGEIFMKV